MKITAIILAGGKSLRLGRNKAMEPFMGTTMIERVISVLQPLAGQLLIVTSKETNNLPSLAGTEIVVDIYPGKGPLSGIYTGLTAARYKNSIVVGCDMPFLSMELLRFMSAQIDGFDAVVPRLSQATIEPLHAVYARSCSDRIKALLENDQLEIYSLFDMLRVRYVAREECMKFDPQLLSFLNINSQSDLNRAVSLARRFEVKSR